MVKKIKLNKKIIISIALMIMIIFILTNNVFATTLKPHEWNPNPTIKEDGKFFLMAGSVLGWIQFIGIIVSVLALAIIGIKYMLGSVEEKSEYKKTMWPYIIGCFMLMGICAIIEIIENIAKI